MWYGADPGGAKCFGLAALHESGEYQTWLCSGVDEAMKLVVSPSAIGIDCPMWWSSGNGGGRKVDRWLRKRHHIKSGTVQSANSLKGSVLVQGIMLAIRIREKFGMIPISETHPKALYVALGLRNWNDIAERFALKGPEPSEHERDALVSAVAVREASRGIWTKNLADDLEVNELDPKTVWYGPVSYWWPNI